MYAVDGDGDMDVLSASANDGKIAWYSTTGCRRASRHTPSPPAQADAYSVYAVDMDGDGDMDLLSASAWKTG